MNWTVEGLIVGPCKQNPDRYRRNSLRADGDRDVQAPGARVHRCSPGEPGGIGAIGGLHQYFGSRLGGEEDGHFQLREPTKR